MFIAAGLKDLAGGIAVVWTTLGRKQRLQQRVNRADEAALPIANGALAITKTASPTLRHAGAPCQEFSPADCGVYLMAPLL